MKEELVDRDSEAVVGMGVARVGLEEVAGQKEAPRQVHSMA